MELIDPILIARRLLSSAHEKVTGNPIAEKRLLALITVAYDIVHRCHDHQQRSFREMAEHARTRSELSKLMVPWRCRQYFNDTKGLGTWRILGGETLEETIMEAAVNVTAAELEAFYNLHL